MKKKVRKLILHRETLRHLSPHELRPVAGADNKPPYTITGAPTNGAYTCTCNNTTTCTSGIGC